MANYVKFKQGLKKDFNTTNQPLTNGMIYFVIDENNHGSIYYDTIVDGKKIKANIFYVLDNNYTFVEDKNANK